MADAKVIPFDEDRARAGAPPPRRRGTPCRGRAAKKADGPAAQRPSLTRRTQDAQRERRTARGTQRPQEPSRRPGSEDRPQ